MTNKLRHNYDVMNIEKNICDSIVGTLFDIQGKTKDHVNARYDLQSIGIRKDLHPRDIGKGRIEFSVTCFSLNAHEKTTFCGAFKDTKLLDEIASNISKCVQVTNKKISSYKSHVAHFMLHYLLPVAIRSTMPHEVADPLIQFGSFFHSICRKVTQLQDMDYLEEEVVQILCQLEMIFPPSFFDIMIHLPIHVPNKVRLGSAVQFRWMYPIERYLCRLKSYVRNKTYPEGSIIEGYLTEKALTFFSRYLHAGVETRLNRERHNYDHNGLCEADAIDYFSNLGCPIRGKNNGKPFSIDLTVQAQAHRYLLFNCDEINMYIWYDISFIFFYSFLSM